MNKIRVGILGCANIALRYLASAFKNHEQFELIAFAGRNINKTQTIAKRFECEALASYQVLIDREDIDLVYIPLPNALHKEWVIKSLQSGKHVICEKSLGCNFTEVELMVDAARRNNRLLFENFQFRFHSQHHFIKNMINNFEIGELRSFRSSFGFPPFSNDDNIRYQKKLGGGALLDAGAYTIKATNFLLGQNFEVKASTLNISKKLAIDTFGGAYMENEDGLFAELAFGFDNFYQCNYEIWGSLGKLTATRAFTSPPGFCPSVIIEKIDLKKEIVLPEDNHFTNMLNHTAECIQTNSFEIENTQNLLQAYNIEQVKIKASKNNY